MLRGEDMSKGKNSLSKVKSYKEIGEFWDTHEITDFWDKTKKAEFEVDIESEITYYALDKSLSEKLHAIAHKRGVSADTLMNLWIHEKLQEQES
jgi:hypothetical protein